MNLKMSSRGGWGWGQMMKFGRMPQWQNKLGSTLVQIISLIAPSHYMNQWLILIGEILWHSPEAPFSLEGEGLEALKLWFVGKSWPDYCWPIWIITLVRHKKARFDSKMHGSTQKSPVRHKNARFDTKMPGSTQKCPPQLSPSWHCHYQTSPRPSCEKYFFPILFQYFVFKNQ